MRRPREIRICSLIAILAVCLVGPAKPLAAGDRQVVEEYPGGKKKASYFVNEVGQKNGLYEAFYPDGQRKTSAQYVGGQLHGVVTDFGSGGTAERIAGYREGKLHGRVREFFERTATKDEFYSEGVLLVPKSREMIVAMFDYLSKSPVATVGEFPKANTGVQTRLADAKQQLDRENAVRNLKCYRYLCDLPYSDIGLDRDYIAKCEAGSDLLSAIGRLEHTPANPGWPEADYRLGYEGTSHSNICQGETDLAKTIAIYMNDSDGGNIRELGHRRWCLNPRLQYTGLGRSGVFSTMWSMDSRREHEPDYETVLFPPRGLTPIEAFKDNYAWSATLNPRKFQPPEESQVKVKVVAAKLNPTTGVLEKGNPPYALDFFRVSNAGYGVPNCIIFRPAAIKAEAGAAYWCEITGLKTAQGADTSLGYFVGFFKMK